MEHEIIQRIDAIEKKVDQMRRYFLWVLVISILAVVLPFIGLLFIIPQFISSYQNLGL